MLIETMERLERLERHLEEERVHRQQVGGGVCVSVSVSVSVCVCAGVCVGVGVGVCGAPAHTLTHTRTHALHSALPIYSFNHRVSLCQKRQCSLNVP